MILLKITEKEKPVILEALHFFGGEIQDRMKSMGEDNDLESWAEMLTTIDQMIDVIKLTNQKPVC
jgi:hypothetical protein